MTPSEGTLRELQSRRNDVLLSERAVGHEKLLDRKGGKRRREVEPLSVAAAKSFQLERLQVALHALGDDAGIERTCERQNAFDDGGTIGEEQTAHERPIDLERVD